MFYYPARVASSYAVGRNVLNDHAASTYHRPCTDMYAFEDYATCSNKDVITYYDFGILSVLHIYQAVTPVEVIQRMCI